MRPSLEIRSFTKVGSARALAAQLGEPCGILRNLAQELLDLDAILPTLDVLHVPEPGEIEEVGHLLLEHLGERSQTRMFSGRKKSSLSKRM